MHFRCMLSQNPKYTDCIEYYALITQPLAIQKKIKEIYFESIEELNEIS